MSIIDNDATNGNRSTPTLNTNDSAVVRKAHNTYGNTLRRVGSAVKQFMSFAQGIVQAKDADGNRSFFLGYDPAISTRPVIRIAKDGYDAVDTTNDNLVFNSEQNVLKVALSGTISIIAVAGSGVAVTVDISDLGLTAPPLVIAAALSPSSTNTYYPMPFIQNPGTTSNVAATAWTGWSSGGDKEIRFQVELGAAAGGHAGAWSIKYYVLQESAV